MIRTEVRRAAPEEGPAVLGVLDEAARWLAQRGIDQWPAEFRAALIEPGLGAGEVWLAERAGEPVGTLTVQWRDPLWPDDGRAGYVHRLAVRRSATGLGRELLEWAAAMVGAQGCELLRLDCDAKNHALRRYYETAGFGHCGDVEIPVAGFTRSVAVSRYERSL